MSDKHYVHAPDTTKLEALLKQSRPWFERYSTAMIYGVAAVMAIAAALIWFNRQPSGNASGSEALMLARTAEDFQDVADRFPDSEIGIRARLRQADAMLETAMSNLFSNRKVGIEELDSAEKAYENLASRSDLSPDVRQRVLVGLARIIESRCDGSNKTVDAAVAAWQRVLDEDNDSGLFRELADERISELPQESSRSFYAWFQMQDPKPGDDLTLPQDRPTTVPDVPDLSDIPGLDLNSLIRTPASDSTPGESPAPESPTSPDAPEDTPATQNPADQPAANGATPADQPATEGQQPAAESGNAPAADPAATEPATEPGTDAPAEPATGTDPGPENDSGNPPE